MVRIMTLAPTTDYCCFVILTWQSRDYLTNIEVQTNQSPFNQLCTVLTQTLSLECVLVQPGLVRDLLHPQHHLIDQTSQVLPENEVH